MGGKIGDGNERAVNGSVRIVASSDARARRAQQKCWQMRMIGGLRFRLAGSTSRLIARRRCRPRRGRLVSTAATFLAGVMSLALAVTRLTFAMTRLAFPVTRLAFTTVTRL